MSSDEPTTGETSGQPGPLSDQDEIWRRIPPGRLVFDENQLRRRPSSDCFKDHPNGSPMSAYSAAITSDPQKILNDLTGFGVAAISMREVRALGLTIVPKPKPGEEGHVEVVGKKTGSIRSKLAKASRLIICPTDL